MSRFFIRFSKPRSDLFAITQFLPVATFQRSLLCFVYPLIEGELSAYAGLILTQPPWYVRSCANMAQIVRAILLASATTTTFDGLRLPNSSTHAPGCLACVNTERAP